MKFALLNMLRDPSQINALVLSQIADALERQFTEHVAPFCDEGPASVDVAQDLANVPADTIPLMCLDDAQQAGELGVHTFDGTRPQGFAFWGPLSANGGTLTQGPLSLTVTLSHEGCEIIGDPYTVYWADKLDGTLTALELCDAVEDQAYPIDGVFVSDFLCPRWFRQGPGPYHFLATKPTGAASATGDVVLLSSPFQVTPGGYTIDESVVVSGPGGSQTKRVRSVEFGAMVPEWKKALKLEKSRTRMRTV